jgi:nucleotide exchange factor SIL1
MRMMMASYFKTNVVLIGIFLAVCISLAVRDVQQFNGQEGRVSLFGYSKEVEVTKEWQLLGENDTIPAGMHVRMDLTTGQKWVKLIDPEEGDDPDMAAATEKSKATGSSSTGAVSMAVIQEDGSVKVHDNDKTVPKYDFEMMHRTLSNLPDDEKERMGGLPELPQTEAGTIKITNKEREAFEKRMLEIWKKRQEELAILQEMIMDLPEVLKQRIKSIDEYLKNPQKHLEDVDLDAEFPDGVVTHIISVLNDLEFQLSDVDMTRDFHTMGGWPLLTQLLVEDSHLPANKTIGSLSRKTEAKIRAIQAQAAWSMGTAVKNTGEFFPYAVEMVVIENGTKSTTPIEVLIDVFCKSYDDNYWEIRTLFTKCIYAIGAMLRGNRLSQSHVLKTSGLVQLGKKYKELSHEGFTSVNTKLIQKLASLAADIIEDVTLHPDFSDADTNSALIEAVSTADWCDATCNALTSEAFIPVKVQESLLHAFTVLSPYCHWSCASTDTQAAIEKMAAEWKENKNDFDDEHLQQVLALANEALDSLNSSGTETV